ncbi:hypothetical protein CG709_17965 [Lachnotalea glycerini]|nr:hypothetical protein CG709_17965 [Lachnotalea glycerini]
MKNQKNSRIFRLNNRAVTLYQCAALFFLQEIHNDHKMIKCMNPKKIQLFEMSKNTIRRSYSKNQII